MKAREKAAHHFDQKWWFSVYTDCSVLRHILLYYSHNMLLYAQIAHTLLSSMFASFRMENYLIDAKNLWFWQFTCFGVVFHFKMKLNANTKWKTEKECNNNEKMATYNRKPKRWLNQIQRDQYAKIIQNSTQPTHGAKVFDWMDQRRHGANKTKQN